MNDTLSCALQNCLTASCKAVVNILVLKYPRKNFRRRLDSCIGSDRFMLCVRSMLIYASTGLGWAVDISTRMWRMRYKTWVARLDEPVV